LAWLQAAAAAVGAAVKWEARAVGAAAAARVLEPERNAETEVAVDVVEVVRVAVMAAARDRRTAKGYLKVADRSL
jgi:hypothetical protein